MEKEIIKEIINRDEKMIISLGGGSYMNEEVRAVLKNRALTIWLFAEIDEILRRVGGKTNRPLLNYRNKRKVLEDLAAKRYPTYKEADFKFDTTNENHETLINRIIKKIYDK